MKKMKKIAAMLLALILTLGLTCTAFAADNNTGSITIKASDNVSVEGKTFSAYRILDLTLTGEDDSDTDADERGYVYTVPDELKSFYSNYFDIDTSAGDFSAQVVNAIAKLDDNSEELFSFATAALSAAKTAGLTAYTATGTEGASSVTISNLPLGYYVVEDTGATTPVSALMLDTTNMNIDITVKADEPSLDKKIVEGTTEIETNNASVGDTVNFKLTSSVPDMTGYTKYYFVVTDTLSKGLTYDQNSLEIKVGDTSLIKDTGYELTVTENTDGTTAIEIVFKNFIQYADQTDDAIVITYSASLNEEAVIGVEGNDNTAKLTYSNNPNVEDGDDDDNNPDTPAPASPTGETPEAITTTYVTGIELTKINNAGDILTGAVFTLNGDTVNIVEVSTEVYKEDENGTYWKLTDGTYTTAAPVIGGDGDNSSSYESTDTKYSKSVGTEWVATGSDVTATATVDSNGVLVFNGLSAGTYTITEIVAPDGYNLLDEPIEISISWTEPANGAGTDCTWSVSSTGDTDTEKVAVVNSKGIITLDVVNRAGTILPGTGGIGTTIFYIIGGILVFGAAVLLITRKRMKKTV